MSVLNLDFCIKLHRRKGQNIYLISHEKSLKCPIFTHANINDYFQSVLHEHECCTSINISANGIKEFGRELIRLSELGVVCSETIELKKYQLDLQLVRWLKSGLNYKL